MSGRALPLPALMDAPVCTLDGGFNIGQTGRNDNCRSITAGAGVRSRRREPDKTMPDQGKRPIVYLAGPDVFFPDAEAVAARKKDSLARRGMTGCFPLDTGLDPAAYADEKAFAIAIARANEALMRQADIVLANIQPWRGPEADDGTAYEAGFMAALGKLIVLYTNDARPFDQRIREDIYQGETYRDGRFERGQSDRMMIESFGGLADNLMLINAAVASADRATGAAHDPAAIVHPDFESAADFARGVWDSAEARRSPKASWISDPGALG